MTDNTNDNATASTGNTTESTDVTVTLGNTLEHPVHVTLPVATFVPPLMQIAAACTKTAVNNADLTPCILFELAGDTLTLTGQNQSYQLSYTFKLPNTAITDDNGQMVAIGTGSQTFAIEASKCAPFFKSLGEYDDVCMCFVPDRGILSIQSGTGSYTLSVHASQEAHSSVTSASITPSGYLYTKYANEGVVSVFGAVAQALQIMLAKTMFCVSHENFRDYLKGVRLEVYKDKLNIFCLDGHRMAQATATLCEPAITPTQFSLTYDGANVLAKMLAAMPDRDMPLTIQRTDNQMVTAIGDYQLKIRLLRCNYPNVRAVFPKELEASAFVNAAQLSTYFKRLSPFTNNRLRAVNVKFDTTGKVELTAKNTDGEIGQASMEATGTLKDPMVNNWNVDILVPIIDAIETEQVEFGFAKPYNNTVFKAVYPENMEADKHPPVTLTYICSHVVV